MTNALAGNHEFHGNDPSAVGGNVPIPGMEQYTAGGELLTEGDEGVLAFKVANLGFIPDARRAITLSMCDMDDYVEKMYRGIENHPTDKIEKFYEQEVHGRQNRAWNEILALGNANSSIEHLNRSTFTPEALRNNASAMETVALFQVRVNALAESNWTKTHVDQIEKAKKAELAIISKLNDEDLTALWNAAWDSTRREYRIWTVKSEAIRKNIRVDRALGNE